MLHLQMKCEWQHTIQKKYATQMTEILGTTTAWKKNSQHSKPLIPSELYNCVTNLQ